MPVRTFDFFTNDPRQDPIIQLTHDNGSLKSDKKKFEEILVHHHEKKKKLTVNIVAGREDIANLSELHET